MIGVNEFLFYINLGIIWYFLFVNIGYILLFIAAIPDICTKFTEWDLGNIELFTNSNMVPPICILVPAYNEEIGVLNTIQSILNSDYPNLQICIINDGSSDSTMDVLFEFCDLVEIFPIIVPKIEIEASYAKYYLSKKYPNLQVIDKEHSGKSDSLNMGINACTVPLFMSVDADTLLETNTISILAYSLLTKPHTIADGGSIYVLNGCEYNPGELIQAKMSLSPLIAMQTCEYLRAFTFGRTGWKLFNGPLILSGALTLLERQAVIDIGGYKLDCPGEDMEVIIALHEYMREHKYPYRIGYSISAAAWTHVPTSMNTLWAQRDRWHKGLIDSLINHKKMFFNSRFGATGLLTYPFQVFVEFLGPIVEFIGYVAVIIGMYCNAIDWRFAILFFVVTWGFGAVITLGVTLISLISFNKYRRLNDIFFLFFLATFESIGYRQILSMCRFNATIKYFFKRIHK